MILTDGGKIQSYFKNDDSRCCQICCSHCLSGRGLPVARSGSRCPASQSEPLESADSRQPITARVQTGPPHSVRCPETCQGFDCGVFERGTRAGTVCEMPNKTKKDKVSFGVLLAAVQKCFSECRDTLICVYRETKVASQQDIWH